MTTKVKIEISKEALAVAEKDAAASGFPNAESYVEAMLLEEDAVERQPWFREKIEEGLASGGAGPYSRERLSQLAQEGIALAKRDNSG